MANIATFLKKMQDKYPLSFELVLEFESSSDSIYDVLEDFFASHQIVRITGDTSETWEAEFEILERQLKQ